MDACTYADIDCLPLARADGLVLVMNTPKGRGVFASKPIAKGTIIDISPVLVISKNEVDKHTSQTCLRHYTYYWPSTSDRSTTEAVALGLGSMFNHSTAKQNVVWKRNIESQCIIYEARCDIKEGEELCISYGSGRLWFEDTDVADSDDEWSKVRDKKALTQSSEIELSGIGNIELEDD